MSRLLLMAALTGLSLTACSTVTVTYAHCEDRTYRDGSQATECQVCVDDKCHQVQLRKLFRSAPIER